MHWFVERILVGRPDQQTIAKYAKGSDRYLGVFLLISAALLGLALTQPIMTSQGFVGLDGSFSLLSAMAALLKGGQGGVALLIAVLSVLLPVVLLSTAFELWYKYELTDPKFLRKTQLLRQLGRLWYLSLLVIGAAIYLGSRADSGLVLHVAVYYLLISLAMQKLVAARLQPLINAVQFVDEEEG